MTRRDARVAAAGMLIGAILAGVGAAAGNFARASDRDVHVGFPGAGFAVTIDDEWLMRCSVAEVRLREKPEIAE